MNEDGGVGSPIYEKSNMKELHIGKKGKQMPADMVDNLKDQIIEMMSELQPEVNAIKKKILQRSTKDGEDHRAMSLISTACINIAADFTCMGIMARNKEEAEEQVKEFTDSIRMMSLEMHLELKKKYKEHKMDEKPSYIG